MKVFDLLKMFFVKNNEKKIQHHLFLTKDAGVNDFDCFGGTPLMYAALRGDAKEVNRLIEKGAKINATDLWGQTALMAAVYSANEPTIKALINSGANVDIENVTGKTALAYARTQEIRDLLNSATATRKVAHARQVAVSEKNSGFCRE